MAGAREVLCWKALPFRNRFTHEHLKVAVELI
jgi:hypothetical protein